MNLWLPGGRNWERDSQEVWDGHVHTAMFKIDNQQGPPVQHRELCSMLRGILDGREVQGRMDTCIGMAQSLCSSPETITTLLIGYTPIQNKQFIYIYTHTYIHVYIYICIYIYIYIYTHTYVPVSRIQAEQKQVTTLE